MKFGMLFGLFALIMCSAVADPVDGHVSFSDDSSELTEAEETSDLGSSETIVQNSLTPGFSMSEIEKEAEREAIKLPKIECALQMFSQKASGFVSLANDSRVNESKSLDESVSTDDSLIISQVDSDPRTVFWRAYEETYSTRLVSFITNRGVNQINESYPLRERLAVEDNKLIAKETSVDEAAHFMVKRFPPLCASHNFTADPVSKPVYVQLMLVDKRHPDKHGSLLNVEHRPLPNAGYDGNSRVEVNLMKLPGEPSCSAEKNPTAHASPGTLFTLSYKKNCF